MSNLETAELEIDAECPALFEAANPKVYRRNAFRVSGLPVEATPRDISRHAEKLRILQRYNVGDNGKTPLAIDPPPDQYAVREALHEADEFYRVGRRSDAPVWPCPGGGTREDPRVWRTGYWLRSA